MTATRLGVVAVVPIEGDCTFMITEGGGDRSDRGLQLVQSDILAQPLIIARHRFHRIHAPAELPNPPAKGHAVEANISPNIEHDRAAR